LAGDEALNAAWPLADEGWGVGRVHGVIIAPAGAACIAPA
jgi:hypothetical protein